jgi:hypothetical protein
MLRGEAQFLQPGSNLFSALATVLGLARGTLRLQGGAKLSGRELLPREKKQPQRNAVRSNCATPGARARRPSKNFDERQL